MEAVWVSEWVFHGEISRDLVDTVNMEEMKAMKDMKAMGVSLT